MPTARRHPPLTDPGALLATTHEAGDGLRVRLRLTRPSDAPRVQAFLDGLSEETRRRRFASGTPVASDALVRHFTFYNPRERLVVVATAPMSGREEIVGLADVVLLSTGLAELAVVVDDDAQGQGVGKLLTESIASLAIQQGATHVKAELSPDSSAMLRLMERLGPTVRTVEDGTLVVHARLPDGRRRAA
jgi:GNAT superfamily N-acetyltransferase